MTQATQKLIEALAALEWLSRAQLNETMAEVAKDDAARTTMFHATAAYRRALMAREAMKSRFSEN